MIALILKAWANPLVRKGVLYGVGALAVLYALRLWGNAQWAKGEAAGRKNAAQSIEKAKLEEWKAKARVIVDQSAKLAADRQTLDEQFAELRLARQNLQEGLSRSLNQIDKTREANNAKVNAVPDALLDSAIRNVSGELAGSAAQ
jgi:acetyl-CoA carboxylase carboxyltransferase component